MTVAVALWQVGIDQGTWQNEFTAEPRLEPMHFVALVTAAALGLGGIATAYLYHNKSDPPQRFASWQELSAAQPSCRSMTNLNKLYPAGVGGLQCSVPGVACARNDWMCADLN